MASPPEEEDDERDCENGVQQNVTITDVPNDGYENLFQILRLLAPPSET